MNVLMDINHPAHVHLLRNVYFSLTEKGHNVTVTVKEIPSAMELLDLYGIRYINIGKKDDKMIKKGWNQLLYDWRLLRMVRERHIDIGLGTSINIAHVSSLSKMDSIILDDDDDEVEPLFVKFGHPFANTVFSPVGTHRETKKTIYMHTYHELAYLHPCRFTPDSTVLSDAGVKEGDPFFVLRFNAFKAYHDTGAGGLTTENKRRLVELLKTRGKVFITTEREIDEEFKSYQLTVPPEKMHSLLYYAKMFVGDSQTMTSEAAVLGTPAIRCNTFVGRIHYLEEEEHKYGLTYGFLPEQSEAMFQKIDELLALPDLKQKWQDKRMRMVSEKIDYSRFLTWFVENYPESKRIVRDNPEYQFRFK